MTVDKAAPGKINLTLHVTGLRADGLHLLDSIVVFTEFGDRISARADENLSLQITGPFAEQIPGGRDNLILAAADLLANFRGAKIHLEKNLPVASGIGGGSADAAATLRALAELWQTDLPSDQAVLGLGADVPVCLHGRPVRMQGIGENLLSVRVPVLNLLLVNPGVEVPTGRVFAGLKTVSNPPMSAIPDFADQTAALVNWLANQRNDMQATAQLIAPQIGDALDAINAQPGCLLARMSGSGATCFGIFPAMADVREAANFIKSAHPDWWVQATKTLS